MIYLKNTSYKNFISITLPLVCFIKKEIFSLLLLIVIIPLGVYMSYWKMAYFPHGGTDSVLSDKKVFDTLVRIHPSGDKMADAFTNIFSEFGWSRAAMVTSYGFCDLGSRAIYSALKVRLKLKFSN